MIVGSGLDTRSWHLDWSEGTVVFELDADEVVEFVTASSQDVLARSDPPDPAAILSDAGWDAESVSIAPGRESNLQIMTRDTSRRDRTTRPDLHPTHLSARS